MDSKARIRELTASGMRISEAGKQASREAQAEANRLQEIVREREEQAGR